MIKTTFYLKNGAQITVLLKDLETIKGSSGMITDINWRNPDQGEQLLHIDINEVVAITYCESTE